MLLLDIIREAVGAGLQLIVEIWDSTLVRSETRKVTILDNFSGCSLCDANQEVPFRREAPCPRGTRCGNRIAGELLGG